MIYWAKKQKPKRQATPFNNKPRILNREKAAYIKLRRFGVSLNQISKAFGRSTSAVWRIIKNAESYRLIRIIDNRKLPAGLRCRSASFRWQTLMRLMPQWTKWICEDSERPP